MALTHDEHLFYQRQLTLPELGEAGQTRLKNARVLVIGAGGLGSPVALYLAAAGVGELAIMDHDQVSLSNLHRQILYTTDDLGQDKSALAQHKLSRLNPHINISAINEALTASNALSTLQDFDVIVDTSDNFNTRYIANDACVLLNKPLVYGSVFRFEGQASVFHYQNGPCYRCLFPEPPPPATAPSCAQAGVLGVLPSVIAGIQATETLKIIAQIGHPLSGKILHYNALDMAFYPLNLARNANCPACGDQPVISQVQTVHDDLSALPIISPDELRSGLKSNEYWLIDVREPHERALSAIEPSQSIPLADLQTQLSSLPNDKTLVLYCQSGQRSKIAVQQLLESGFPRCASLQGGISAYFNPPSTSQKPTLD